MKRFEDNEGREWALRINVNLIETVRNRLDIDLADMTTQTFFTLADDPVRLVNVLWVLVEAQADKAGVTAASFGESLVGDAIDDATAALLEAITDFFPKRKRALYTKIIELNRRSVDEGERLAEESLADPATRERINRAMKADRDRALAEALTQLESATNSEASSESTPEDSPGET